MSGMFSVCSEDIIVAENTDFVSVLDSEKDFVQFFPPELCNKLFSYVSDKDIFACSQCSNGWRHVINNNSRWKQRCIRKGWYKEGRENDPLKWTNTKSHVGEEEYQFRPTPLFNLPPVASLRIEELCDWAKYYRQCAHLECNWKLGRYALHKLSIPEEIVPTIYNACDCNGKIFAAGTTMGYILVWSVNGRPKFLKPILAIGKRVEVEQLRLTSQYMIVLCQAGVLQCYNISNEVLHGKEPYEILYQIRIGGRYVNENTYSFHVDLIPSDQLEDLTQLIRPNDHGGIWIQEPRTPVSPWLENDYMACDIFFSISGNRIILSGISANALYFIDTCTGRLVKQLELPLNTQICYKTVVRGSKIYLSVRRSHDFHSGNFSYHLLVYDLKQVLEEDFPNHLEFAAHSMLEEIHGDEDDKRLVWVSQDSVIEGKDLDTQMTLFVRHGLSYIDNLTVHGETIIYHQYDGFIIAIDWDGNQKYEIEIRIGIVRGLRCSDQFLISGGDTKNLLVWNNELGTLYHKVHHQPCRIEFLYADETKIITLGREDPPVVVGYW